ncbi:MAG TPA: type II secretion system protein [Bryobacteraceae bacterium]|nr:type II secretion system protein [Bryobacteraceae bacterium]
MDQRGFTLLEMIVATTIMAVAIVGLLAGLAGTTHNAARLQDYDRAVELGRERMNELIMDLRLPHDTPITGTFGPAETVGLDAGWRARLTTFEYPPVLQAGESVLDRLELEIWWKSAGAIRTYTLEAYRPRASTPEDFAAAAAAAAAKAAPKENP